jgi:hypothetical protein
MLTDGHASVFKLDHCAASGALLAIAAERPFDLVDSADILWIAGLGEHPAETQLLPVFVRLQPGEQVMRQHAAAPFPRK